MTIASESAELNDLIARTFQEMGGRATLPEIRATLHDLIPAHLRRHLIGKGLDTAVGRYFRSQNEDGLPVAPAVDEHGTHVQLELLTVEEYRYAVRRQKSAERAANAQARKYVDRCRDVHGVDISDELADLGPMVEQAAS